MGRTACVAARARFPGSLRGRDGARFCPILLANRIFAERFRIVGSSTVAFGANLLGAMVGGVLEYSSLIVGYRDLLPLVALLYVGAFLCNRRREPHGAAFPIRASEPLAASATL